MKTQKRINSSVSFIALFAIMILTGTTNLYSQQEAGRDGAPASAADSVIIAAVQDTAAVQKTKAPCNHCKHEFNVWAGGGYSSLNTFPNYGDRTYRFGGILGLGYAFHFNPHWALSLGAEIALYNMKMRVNDLTDSYPTLDPDDEEITYIAQLNSYTEKQRLYQLQIPLQLWFQTRISGRGDELYLSLGGKFGLPLSAQYRVRNADFQTAGYYPEFNQTLYDQPDLGYGNHTGRMTKEKLNFDFSYIGSAEAGVKWKIENPRYNLYTGFYFDYGFNNILKANDNTFLSYDPHFPERFVTNSVLTSQYTTNGETNSFADKLSVVALGVKVRLGFNLCHIDKDKKDKKADKEKEKNDKESADDVDPYRKGYRDAYNDMADAPARRNNVRPIEPEAERKGPFYVGDPLLEAEMRRAAGEYGNLVDLLVLYVDGYEINQTELSPIMKKMIDDKIRLLQRYNNDRYIIIVEGHTCDLGREDFNMRLGQMRAEVVREYLMSRGFNGDNLIPTSKGKTSPIVPNTSEANRKLNRRVVFLVK